MMKNTTSLLYVGLIALTACVSKPSTSPVSPTDTVPCIVVTDSGIVTPFAAKPSQTIDVARLKAHVAAYPQRWKTAFEYLIHLRRDSLPAGRILLSDEVYVSINKYEPMSLSKKDYEDHRRYIDIQYIVTGSELISLSNDTTMPVVKAYDELDDAIMYANKGGRIVAADHTEFFIFFPGELHIPGVFDGSCKAVRKVVVKVKAD